MVALTRASRELWLALVTGPRHLHPPLLAGRSRGEESECLDLGDGCEGEWAREWCVRGLRLTSEKREARGESSLAECGARGVKAGGGQEGGVREVEAGSERRWATTSLLPTEEMIVHKGLRRAVATPAKVGWRR